MKMSKLQGLKVLGELDISTVELIDPNLLDKNSDVLKYGLSVRTSPKKDAQNNVYLPSIHNIRDLDEIREFINQYQRDYDIIVHKTVRPELLGSVSKYQMSPEEERVIIELFQDFEKRKEGIIKNRVSLPVLGGRFMISQMNMENDIKEDFTTFSKIIRNVKNIPFETYDAEFVLENGRTD